MVSKVKSGKALEDFILIFGKLLQLYYKEGTLVLLKYIKTCFLKSFQLNTNLEKLQLQGKKKKRTLKEQAPEVFVSGYPTKCGKQPRIISAEEAKEATNAVMQYPKTSTEGFPQRWYICDQTGSHPYPRSTSINDLSNDNIVPYLPCCFKTEQDLGPKGEAGKQTKPYANYFYDVPSS